MISNEEKYAAVERPILAELAEAGMTYGSLEELRTSGTRYQAAVPILVRWLQAPLDVKIREEVVRTLSVPWAKTLATQPLLDAFRTVDKSDDPSGMGLRWAIGNALWVLAGKSDLPQLIELVSDRRFGIARQMVVLALGKINEPESVNALLKLVDDPDVDGHAIKSLAKLKAPAARTAFEAKLTDNRAWVRREAKNGLARLAPSA